MGGAVGRDAGQGVGRGSQEEATGRAPGERGAGGGAVGQGGAGKAGGSRGIEGRGEDAGDGGG